jgi:hypothetical protein
MRGVRQGIGVAHAAPRHPPPAARACAAPQALPGAASRQPVLSLGFPLSVLLNALTTLLPGQLCASSCSIFGCCGNCSDRLSAPSVRPPACLAAACHSTGPPNSRGAQVAVPPTESPWGPGGGVTHDRRGLPTQGARASGARKDVGPDGARQRHHGSAAAERPPTLRQRPYKFIPRHCPFLLEPSSWRPTLRARVEPTIAAGRHPYNLTM